MAETKGPVRLIDVADAAGVSIASASRALSGSHGISEALSSRVQEIADELGYVGNAHARSLAGGSTRSVGLVVHEIGDAYFTEIASGVLQLAARERLTVQICHTGRDPELELLQVRSLVANRVGAILISGSGYVDAAAEAPLRKELDRFTAQGGRVAVIGRHHLGVDAVLPDNVEGGRVVAEHLIGLGHRRLAIAAGSMELSTVADRVHGIRLALEAHKIPADEVPLIEGAFNRDGGRTCAQTVLDQHPGTTGIIALNDDMAIGCLSVLRAAGIGVPTQMSVTGFDDVAVASDLSPALSTIRLPMAEMGARCLSLALKPPGARARRQTTKAELVVRDSSGPAA